MISESPINDGWTGSVLEEYSSGLRKDPRFHLVVVSVVGIIIEAHTTSHNPKFPVKSTLRFESKLELNVSKTPRPLWFPRPNFSTSSLWMGFSYKLITHVSALSN